MGRRSTGEGAAPPRSYTMGSLVRSPRHRLAASLLAGAGGVGVLVLPARPLQADDVVIQDVQAAAIEMPHSAVLLRRPQGVTPPDQIIPIHVPQEDLLTGEIREEYAFEGFLDTG